MRVPCTRVDTTKTRGVFQVKTGRSSFIITADKNADGWVAMARGRGSGRATKVVLGLMDRDGVVQQNGTVETGKRMAFSQARRGEPFLVTEEVTEIDQLYGDNL